MYPGHLRLDAEWHCIDFNPCHTQLKQHIMRAEACSLNGLETIGIYAASVAIANFAQLDVAVLNRLSIGHLVSRFFYTLSYIFIQNRRLSWIRTAIWQVTAGYIAMFWIRAGIKLA